MRMFHLDFGIFFNFDKGNRNEQIKQNLIDRNICVVMQNFL
jgi:hypothetical protein